MGFFGGQRSPGIGEMDRPVTGQRGRPSLPSGLTDDLLTGYAARGDDDLSIEVTEG